MKTRRSLLRRLKLRTILVVALLLAGIIPLGISSVLLINQSRTVLRNTESDNLTAEAKSLSVQVDASLLAIHRQLAQLGNGILLAPGEPWSAQRLTEPWVGPQLRSFQQGNPDVLALRILDPEMGAGLEPGNLSAGVKAAMDTAFEEAKSKKGRPTASPWAPTASRRRSSPCRCPPTRRS